MESQSSGSEPTQTGLEPPIILQSDNTAPLPVRRSGVLVSWLAIVCVSVIAVLLQQLTTEDLGGEEDAASQATGSDQTVGDDGTPNRAEEPTSLLSMQDELAGRVTVGLASFVPPSESKAIFESQLEPLKEGNWAQQVSRWLVIGRMVKVDDAIRGLDEIERVEGATDMDATIDAARRVLIAEQAEEELPEGDLALLKDRLGWYGLFIAREAPVESGMIAALVVAGVWFGSFGCAGFVGIFVLFVLLVIGKLKFRIFERASTVDTGEFARIAVETFAVWMALFLGLNVLFGAIAGLALSDPPTLEMGSIFPLLLGSMAFIASLSALCWGNLRGRSAWWLLREAGWHRGAGFIREIAAGFFCYACALPLLLIGLVFYFIAVGLFGDGTPPTHPAAEALQSAGAIELCGLLFLGAVVAPIVEETMFRGLLYRHIRESLQGRGAIVACAIGALVSSWIFAAIHPQGLLFAPVLMGLAISFCLFREWRGSLIGPIVAHSINNAATMSLGFVIMQSPAGEHPMAWLATLVRSLAHACS